MKERPIIFSAPMVCAILEGRKTQTRRTLKYQPIDVRRVFMKPEINMSYVENAHGVEIPHWPCPYGKPGDRLWVRETHEAYYVSRGETSYSAGVKYRADDEKRLISIDALTYQKLNSTDSKGWTPSIHMPRWASRINLEITGIRVERLQDISEQDAMAEGIENVGGKFSCSPWRNYRISKPGEMNMHCASPQRSYMTLWESINGAGSWNINPWVWVIEFKKI
jgi:hypothetical protein